MIRPADCYLRPSPGRKAAMRPKARIGATQKRKRQVSRTASVHLTAADWRNPFFGAKRGSGPRSLPGRRRILPTAREQPMRRDR